MPRRKVDPKTSGERLRKLRGIRTRVGVAKELGISYSALSFYENGDRTPSSRVMEKLARYYGVTVESIFFEE